MLLSTRVKFIVVAALFAVAWFANLQYRDLFQTDEGRYAEIPREMVASNDWVTPHLDGFKYFEKPALQYWTTAIAYKLFGESNWSSRLWTALTGFFGVLMTAWVGWRLFDRRTAWCAALLLGSSMVYVIMGHFNTLDMGVTFFMCLSVFAFLLAMQAGDRQKSPGISGAEGTAQVEPHASGTANVSARRGWMYVAWAAAALALLSKGLEAIVLPGAAFVIYTLITRDWKRWRQLHWYGGLLIFMVIGVPWFVAVCLRNPDFFFRFFIYEHFYRYLTPDAHRYGAWWYFIPVLLFGLLPWWPQFLRAAIRLVRPSTHSQDGAFNHVLFLWIWCILVFAFFSFSDSKLASYILPIFPALALLTGYELGRCRRLDALISAAICMMLAIINLWLAPLIQQDGSNVSLHLYQSILPWMVAGSALLLIAGIVAFFLAYFRYVAAALAVTGAGLFLSTQIVTSGAQVLSPVYSGHYLARQISVYNKPGIPFYSINDYQQSLPFYLNRTLTLVAYKGELAFGISRDPQKWIPDVDSFIKRWQSDSQALAVMPIATYHQLKKKGVPMQVIGQDPERIAVRKP